MYPLITYTSYISEITCISYTPDWWNSSIGVPKSGNLTKFVPFVPLLRHMASWNIINKGMKNSSYFHWKSFNISLNIQRLSQFIHTIPCIHCLNRVRLILTTAYGENSTRTENNHNLVRWKKCLWIYYWKHLNMFKHIFVKNYQNFWFIKRTKFSMCPNNGCP